MCAHEFTHEIDEKAAKSWQTIANWNWKTYYGVPCKFAHWAMFLLLWVSINCQLKLKKILRHPLQIYASSNCLISLSALVACCVLLGDSTLLTPLLPLHLPFVYTSSNCLISLSALVACCVLLGDSTLLTPLLPLHLPSVTVTVKFGYQIVFEFWTLGFNLYLDIEFFGFNLFMHPA